MRKFRLLFIESFRMTVDFLKVNKMRSALSILSVTIGIFTIIGVFTFTDSLAKNIKKSVEELGEELVVVQKWPWFFGGDGGEQYEWWDFMKRPHVRYGEFKIIEERVDRDLVENVTYAFRANSSTLSMGNVNAENVTVMGTGLPYFPMMGLNIEEGRAFNPIEEERGKNVAVIGGVLAQKLFGSESPVNKFVKFNGKKVLIIGLLELKGNGFGGPSYDHMCIVPTKYLGNYIDMNGGRNDPQILIKGKKGIGIDAIEGETIRVMRGVRRLKPKEDQNFAVNKFIMIQKQLNSTFGMMDQVAFYIGFLSLLVGGFGIANIMFVGVKERTGIIGIQKALGAKKAFILMQFLYEAVLLCIIAGLIGIVLVSLITLFVNLNGDFKVYMSFKNIFRGISISALIGLLSGILPAYSAAKLDPVEAIRK